MQSEVREPRAAAARPDLPLAAARLQQLCAVVERGAATASELQRVLVHYGGQRGGAHRSGRPASCEASTAYSASEIVQPGGGQPSYLRNKLPEQDQRQ